MHTRLKYRLCLMLVLATSITYTLSSCKTNQPVRLEKAKAKTVTPLIKTEIEKTPKVINDYSAINEEISPTNMNILSTPKPIKSPIATPKISSKAPKETKVNTNNDFETAKTSTTTPKVLEKTPATSVREVSDAVKKAMEKSKGTFYGVKPRYQKHIYGCRKQSEYDAAMKIIDKAIADIDKIELPDYYVAYLQGTRAEEFDIYSNEYAALTIVHKNIGYFISKIDKKDIIPAIKAGLIAGRLLRNTKHEGKPRSAYDALVLGISDCDSDAQVKSAIYDSLGYNTKVLGLGNDAWPIVEIGGKWWNVAYSSFIPANPNPKGSVIVN